MRFRLRDILLLTVLLAAYLTTLNRVLATRWGESYQKLLLISAVALFSFLLLGFLLGHRIAVRRIGTIELGYVPEIPWKILTGQVLLLLVFGWAAVLFENATVIAAFVVGSIPLVISLLLVFLFNTLRVSSTGILYHFVYRPWKAVKLARTGEGSDRCDQLGISCLDSARHVCSSVSVAGSYNRGPSRTPATGDGTLRAKP